MCLCKGILKGTNIYYIPKKKKSIISLIHSLLLKVTLSTFEKCNTPNLHILKNFSPNSSFLMKRGLSIPWSPQGLTIAMYFPSGFLENNLCMFRTVLLGSWWVNINTLNQFSILLPCFLSLPGSPTKSLRWTFTACMLLHYNIFSLFILLYSLWIPLTLSFLPFPGLAAVPWVKHGTALLLFEFLSEFSVICVIIFVDLWSLFHFVLYLSCDWWLGASRLNGD